MPQLIDDTDHDEFEATDTERNCRAQYREQMISLLPQIASEVTAALTVAGLHIPVFFCVPASGDSLLSFATSVDPSDAEWERITDIIRGVVEDTSGIDNLAERELPCIAAGTATIAVAELCIDATGSPGPNACATSD
jgi:hypothetical protein